MFKMICSIIHQVKLSNIAICLAPAWTQWLLHPIQEPGMCLRQHTTHMYNILQHWLWAEVQCNFNIFHQKNEITMVPFSILKVRFTTLPISPARPNMSGESPSPGADLSTPLDFRQGAQKWRPSVMLELPGQDDSTHSTGVY